MLQAYASRNPSPRTPHPEGSTSTTESTSKTLRHEVSPPPPPPCQNGGVTTEATAPVSNDRAHCTLLNWHDIFRHINRCWFKSNGRNYAWDNAARKILYNAARKYGAAAVITMWDIYFEFRGRWYEVTGGTIYGMVRDSARILDHADFKLRQRENQRRLDDTAGAMSAAEVLKILNLMPGGVL